ncbi:Fur family transcriptional regulator [Enterovibrio coralii]|uniref:Ferric uptake regulation protein n=1 Tax=Enterovibrio coralii TaxID=294935 RepID=A0A135I531_9GAMM|nr:Fur family transcriptional regulator [Enterovibrio coralii]KXF80560.1 Fur family transcriptional regulator [Enterovibrio coralii]
MTDVDSVIKNVEQKCKKRGKPLTEKRKLVLSALIHSGKALSAYELVDYCKTEFDKQIQAMTVYRTLDFLEEQHLAHKLKVSNKFIACSHMQCSHEHGVPQFLICSKCNKIKEQIIEPSVIDGLQSNARKDGFTVTSPQLEITGVCDDCKE